MLHANVKAHPFNSKKPNPVYEKLLKSERSWFYLRIKLQSLIDTRFIVLSRSMLYYQKHLQHYLTILKKVRKKKPRFHPCIQICTTSYWGLFWANIHPSTNQLCSSCVILLKDQPTTKWTREKNLTSAEEISIFPMVSEIFHRIQHYRGESCYYGHGTKPCGGVIGSMERWSHFSSGGVPWDLISENMYKYVNAERYHFSILFELWWGTSWGTYSPV